MIHIRAYTDSDIEGMATIWNDIVDEGNAFPQEEHLIGDKAKCFFAAQSRCAVAEDDSHILTGLYILHPNNAGHCAHIANASFAVSPKSRGRHIGEALVKNCMNAARSIGFRILQFNAVVSCNRGARCLYERLGFIQLGTIPCGFRMNDGHYEDICVYYIPL